ncbi:hypothetical protein ACLOJK_010870 [Asimina triloba]
MIPIVVVAESSAGQSRASRRPLPRSRTAGYAPRSFDSENIPSSLVADIRRFLRVANQIEIESPRAAYLCRFHAFEKAHKMDPNSSGRGVRQFKTSLLQRLEQDEEATKFNQEGISDTRELKRLHHKYSDILKHGGTESTSRERLTRVYAITSVLLDVLNGISGAGSKLPPSGDGKPELYSPYNILPLDPGGAQQTIMQLPEIKAAVEAKGNVDNQREHLILLLANIHIRQIPKPEPLSKLDERAMAHELYGLVSLALSPDTGERVVPVYGGGSEPFLKNVVTPIYRVIYEILKATMILANSTRLIRPSWLETRRFEIYSGFLGKTEVQDNADSDRKAEEDHGIKWLGKTNFKAKDVIKKRLGINSHRNIKLENLLTVVMVGSGSPMSKLHLSYMLDEECKNVWFLLSSNSQVLSSLIVLELLVRPIHDVYVGYNFQVKPLVGPTKQIMKIGVSKYEWHELFPKVKNNAGAIVAVWAPIILVYFMDTQIWYSVLCTIIGGVCGICHHMGEIHTMGMLRSRFRTLPAAFNVRLIPPSARKEQKTNIRSFLQKKFRRVSVIEKNGVAKFTLVWNKIITTFRSEDLISHRNYFLFNREMDLLIIPLSSELSAGTIQWPAFLLAAKLSAAVDMVKEFIGKDDHLYKKIRKDSHMHSAIVECYETLKTILELLVVRELEKRIFDLILHLQPTKDATILFATPEPELFGSLGGNNAICFPLPNTSQLKQKMKRLLLLLSAKESALDIPKNLEARRRISFFATSLFMDMPTAPRVHDMLSFSVMTPYFTEEVAFSKEELDSTQNWVPIIVYMETIYPDEWRNFLERMGCENLDNAINELQNWDPYRGQSLSRTDEWKRCLERMGRKNLDEFIYELRDWASYRGQTLSRTVRGMMYYRKALKLQAFLDMAENESESWVDKYLVEDRVLVEFSAFNLLEGYKGAEREHDKKNNQHLLSAKLDALADMKFTYVISCQMLAKQKASGDQYIGGRYPSLRVAYIEEKEDLTVDKTIKVYSSVLIKAVDRLEQDNYMEEAFKMRNILQEFVMHGGERSLTILGLREHIFTGSVSSLAGFMSYQETSFVTIGQRLLADPLRQEPGHITYREYMQVGKGRDVGLNQITKFEAKVANGNSEQTLSRDIYRLGRRFDFFRMLSCYFTTVGFYFNTLINASTMISMIGIYVFLYGQLYLILSGLERTILNVAGTHNIKSLETALASQSFIQLGLLTGLPMLMEIGLEKGFRTAFNDFILMQMQLSAVFFTFSLGTKFHYYGRTMLHGGAKYRPTGRKFVLFHASFTENYRLYSRSHFVKGFELMLLLVIYHSFRHRNGIISVLATFSIWFMVGTWLFAPFLFNPSGFEWHKVVEDWKDWNKWIKHQGGIGVQPDKSWESWWNEEQTHLRHAGWGGRIAEVLLSIRFFIYQYGLVYHLDISQENKTVMVYILSWVVIGSILLFVKVKYDYMLLQKIAVALMTIILTGWQPGKEITSTSGTPIPTVIMPNIQKSMHVMVESSCNHYASSWTALELGRELMSAEFHLLFRLFKAVLFLGAFCIIITLFAVCKLSMADVFICSLAFLPTGWGLLLIAQALRPLIEKCGSWDSVRVLSKAYDYGMGLLLFVPPAVLSWLPFMPDFQTRLLFNPAFNKHLHVEMILGRKHKDM